MADYKSSTDEGKCIFCEIASGRIEPLAGGKFWEDEKHLAFLSPFPNTEGFSIVSTKKHYSSDILSMPEEELKDFIVAAKKAAGILLEGFDDVGRVGIMIEGMGINHAHMKLYPMHGTGEIKKGEWKSSHSNVNFYFDKYPGYLSSNDGPKADFDKLKILTEKLKKIKGK